MSAIPKVELNDREFNLFRSLFSEHTGILFTEAKKPLLAGRLHKRVSALRLASYKAYYDHITAADGQDELEIAIDLLTTHETYFFREEKHFSFIEKTILPTLKDKPKIRIWSAASSTGEEAYTLAMVLAESRPTYTWEITGSDVSQHVLVSARRGLYVMSRGEKIPLHYLKKYCLKGDGEYSGFFRIDQSLRNNVTFTQSNLMREDKSLGMFDIILLRNVLIYFDDSNKVNILKNVISRLNPGGWLLLGHSETLNGYTLPIKMVATSIYQKR